MTKVPHGRFAEALQPLLAQHPEHSGVLPLIKAREAFAARVLLARQAQFSLDVQYYIWRNDRTGTLLFEALHEAADRGVKVRLLLDDHNTAGLDATLIGLQSHPNIEVRLYNPLRLRRPRFINYLVDFKRVNRRMHNKAFIADEQVLISGGRNIGDEYFAAHDDLVFADLDALMVGPVVVEANQEFTTYWNSALAIPLAKLFTLTKPQSLAKLERRASVIESDPQAKKYVDAVRNMPFVQNFMARQIEFVWARVNLVVDDPRKTLGLANQKQHLAYQLQQAIGSPQQCVRLVSPYFVPTAEGTRQLCALAKQGVAITILTNSLEATDVAVVHAGYAKWRKALLRAGIEIYEVQKVSPLARKQERKLRRQRLKGKERFGGSASSLHAKTFSVDKQRVFLGSFNFDPRSLQLNTELGFVIHSDVLAEQIDQAFINTVPNYAYRVGIDHNDNLYWEERLGPRVTQYASEPGVSWWRRLGMLTLAKLPIDWLL
ncbi:phospholipase D family protein [Pseudidiomarina donghaiensis]|uniref:phospholipase D family protein n=1 Tax=Pseudidiomarina donghaiensis TaxID=519452 RepID=UPI0008EC4737|nr:phospholipase D family protein [Pseudidiomarina donghaiensis]SFV24677.1 Phosphatidylserine/phosphatidylglycerophosphate/cardiolipin synthase [Pseudidiomarina donghaiensis]